MKNGAGGGKHVDDNGNGASAHGGDGWVGGD